MSGPLVWASAADGISARVNGKVLSTAELDAAVYMAARQRFFHGRMDDQRMQQLRLQVLGEMIDRTLLLDEAGARGLVVDKALYEKTHQQLRRRYDSAAMPQDHRQQVEAQLQRQAKEQTLLRAIEANTRAVGVPEEAALEQFYRENIEKFTTPPRLHLAVILLKVAPSAPGQAWQAAEDEARQLRHKIESGADFAELARLHSGDSSAEKGGDLGFVHQGMLSEEAQQAIDVLEDGVVSAPVTLLQGVALFRIEERQAALVNPLLRVRERAQGLWQRQQADQAWQALLARLRAGAKIEIDDGKLDAAMLWVQGVDAARE